MSEQTAEPGPLLRVQGLRKAFGSRRQIRRHRGVSAVDGVDLTVSPGSVLGLVGESGCGKSTTARLIMRLLEPTSGRIEVDGRDITALSTRELRPVRRRMQLVFQDATAALNPRRTVGAAIATGLVVGRPRGAARPGRSEVAERITTVMAQVGLGPELVDRYPHELSGGQRARVGIARALAPGPALLVCDEPVAAVDTSVRAQLVNLFADLRDELGVGLLFISHDLAVVRHLADEVAVMFGGVIVEQAPCEVLFGGAQHPYTHALLDAIPVPEASGAALPAPPRAALEEHGVAAQGCRFRARCPQAQQLCAEVEPPLVTRGPAHSVACHFPSERIANR